MLRIRLYKEQVEDFKISISKILCLGFENIGDKYYQKDFKCIEDLLDTLFCYVLAYTSNKKKT